jgi:hypothetical protein
MEPPGLALGSDEAVAEIQDQVVALVHAPRHQNRVSAPNELVENGALGPLADVDGVVADLWLGQS